MLSEIQLIVPVAVAMLLGGLIGAEREWANKPGGFRTHMLVAGAAALLVGLADLLIDKFATGGEVIGADPIRIVQSIVIGVSFIGAGTIMRRQEGDSIEGLTTAASFLLSAAIGIAVAVDAYALATAVSLLTLLVLRVMRLIEVPLHEHKLRRRKPPK